MIRKQTRYDNISLKNAIVDNNNKELIDFLKNYIENRDEMFNECKNAIITGGVGIGKTYLCKCFINDIRQKQSDFEYVKKTEYNSTTKKYESIFDYETRNINPLMIKFPDMINDIRKTYKGETQDHDYKEYDILIIDEIGVSRGKNGSTEDERLLLFDIIDYRNVNFKPTFIISNYETDDELVMALGRRILSRIRENAKIFKLKGQDRRLK